MKKAFPRIKLTGMLLILAIFFCTPMIGVVQAYTTKLYVDPPKVEYWTPALNKTFMVNVTLANVTDLQAFEFKLYWNTTLLDLVKVDIKPFFEDSVIYINETSEEQGWYWIREADSFGYPKSGSATLVTLSFKITYEPVWPENVTCALDLKDTILQGWPNYLDIPHDVYDGEYSCYSIPPLSLTTMTDKPSYALGDSVHIYGNLTLGSSPLQDGIVAVEVDNPLNEIIVIRSVSTGVPPASQLLEILNVIPCDDQGNPKTGFYRGTPAYFNVTVKSNDIKMLWAWVVINIYDVENRPFSMDAIGTSIAAGSTNWFILGIPIPSTTPIGQAKVYASTFNKWPRQGGAAYCLEKSATFNILGSKSVGAGTLRSSSSPEGTYNLTFKLPPEPIGNYVLYANSEHTMHGQTQTVTNRLTFRVSPLKYDFNGNGEIDISDVRRVAKAYGSAAVDDPKTPWNETQYWDPVVDVYPEDVGDGQITISDIRLVARHYGEHV